MENSLSIQSVLNQKDNYNLAFPFYETQQVNPYYKLTVATLYADTDDKAGHIFKVGSRSLGNNKFEDLYSLCKPFLERLATEAGIQFSPHAGDVTRIDQNTWKASAFGAIKLPDGTIRTSNNFKVIDLLTEEKRYRLAYEEKAANGIEDYFAAKKASERFKGFWKDTGRVNAKGYAIKAYVVEEEDRKRYVEQTLLDAMAVLRAHAPQKAATGAILRVIRDLTGLKSTFTMQELKKPFAVARMSFSPDYNDPLVKQMMLQQCMQSVGNLFGTVTPTMQTISVSNTGNDDDEVDVPVDVLSEKGPSREGASEQRTNNIIADDLCCDECSVIIPQRVWEYSREHYGRPLCIKCQRGAGKL